MAQTLKTDLLIAGGGLAGGLIALALRARRPDVTLTIVEAGEALGGNHIWSFFDSDIAETERGLIAPLICHHWDGNEVRFPGHARSLHGAYNSIESGRFNQVVRAALPAEAIVTGRIKALDAQSATLSDGTRIEAGGVIDARGVGDFAMLELGWQKFLGQLLRLEAPHGLTRPVIMDAAVDQGDGYRFVYLLPFGPNAVFVEDTYYSTTSDLDADELRDRIARYAAEQGWTIATIEREEQAALPIAMGGNFDALWPVRDRVPRVGMAAGLFQPMTGYSLPDAVRTAALIADLPDLSSRALQHALRPYARKAWEQRGFYRLLARMLFRAADPPARYRLLERFYRLDEGLIGRFYAGRSTWTDKARILIGKPPVPLRRALGAIREDR
ncbi:MAG TPA: lycopene beta-cyclase CrtY [Sphingomonas sp.]|uniref:lycopene beta-cyclase CrtY n=1 Tax=Sphingomonas sp. TaxID=28214 RepID=UPI002C08F086|nr:lycopene beta-cyclase CrtY [Sphingomonas sp.]HMI18023.1 lycopene beta-cyclase CrtY [Sphingomonas sp.]